MSRSTTLVLVVLLSVAGVVISTNDPCTAADQAIVTDPSFPKAASACAKQCFGKQDCSLDCLVTQDHLTSPCALCFAEDISCMWAHCKLSCLFDSQSQKCEDCHISSGCLPRLLKCTE